MLEAPGEVLHDRDDSGDWCRIFRWASSARRQSRCGRRDASCLECPGEVSALRWSTIALWGCRSTSADSRPVVSTHLGVGRFGATFGRNRAEPGRHRAIFCPMSANIVRSRPGFRRHHPKPANIGPATKFGPNSADSVSNAGQIRLGLGQTPAAFDGIQAASDQRCSNRVNVSRSRAHM